MNESQPQLPGSIERLSPRPSALSAPVSEIPLSPVTQWHLHGQLNDSGTAQQFSVLTQPFSVGRNTENVLTIPDSTVSGNHAELLLVADGLLVRDLDSTNGTLLNGRRIDAVEPLCEGDILHFGHVMFMVQQGSPPPQHSVTVCADAAGDAMAQVQFGTLLARPGIDPFYQPIVSLDNRSRIGFEVLSRSQFIGLETPEKMFRVAAQRTSEAELSRVCRLEGLRQADRVESDSQFYLNTHPAELNDRDLFSSMQTLRMLYPHMKIMLEVHEAGVTSVSFLSELRRILNDLSIGLAYDDFGAGRARLTELIEVPPDVLKFDVQLVQGLPFSSEQRRSTIQSLIRMARDLNVIPLAEGVETSEEASICLELGFELAQGYLFGRPAPASEWS